VAPPGRKSLAKDAGSSHAEWAGGAVKAGGFGCGDCGSFKVGVDRAGNAGSVVKPVVKTVVKKDLSSGEVRREGEGESKTEERMSGGHVLRTPYLPTPYTGLDWTGR
jgi:hypothetical protein